MRTDRYTIRGLLVAIVGCGLCFASLREASTRWKDITATLCLGIFGFALIASFCGSRQTRIYWGGFALGGLLHLTLSCGPFFQDSLGPRLFTTALLDLTFDRVAKPELPPLPPAGLFPNRYVGGVHEDNQSWYKEQGLDYDFFGWANRSGLHSTATYRQIGQLWFALAIGSVTGWLAVRFQNANQPERSEAT